MARQSSVPGCAVGDACAAYGTSRPIQASAVAEDRSLLVVDQTFVLPKGNAQVQVTERALADASALPSEPQMQA